MSTKTRSLVRTLFAVPSAAVLVFGATQALAAPPSVSRVPDCDGFCESTWEYCAANPTVFKCRYCGC